MKNCMQSLQQLARDKKLPHALLLIGSNADLLQTQGQLFANWLLCGNFSNSTACDNCKTCHLLAANTHADFMALSPILSGDNKIIKIDQIRTLINFVQGRPQFGKHKAAIIFNAENMNIQAANALLRTLEEPPPNTHLILTTVHQKLLLETIVSRCTEFYMHEPGEFKVNAADVTTECVFSTEQIAREMLQELYALFVQRNIHPVEVITHWMQHNDTLAILNYFWLLLTRLIGCHFQADYQQKYATEWQTKLTAIAQKQSLSQLWSILDQVGEARKQILIGRQLNIQLFLESILINWFHGAKNVRIRATTAASTK